MLDNQPTRRGQSLVEFALILPVLVLLLLGTIDLARVFYVKVAMANASRTAATYAANYQLAAQYGPTGATARVIATAHQEATSLRDVQFSTDWQPGSAYTVTVAMDWAPVTPAISQLWGGGPLLLRHTTAMRHNCAAAAACVYVAPTPTPTL